MTLHRLRVLVAKRGEDECVSISGYELRDLLFNIRAEVETASNRALRGARRDLIRELIRELTVKK